MYKLPVFKKIALLFVAFAVSLMLPGTSILANTINTEEDTTASSTDYFSLEQKVFEELRTNKVTDDTDVIRVAIAQSLQNTLTIDSVNTTARLIVDDANAIDCLSIRQCLSNQVESDGNIKLNMCETSLVIRDKEGNILSRDQLQASDNNQISEYQIYLSMTVFYEYNSNLTTRLLSFDSTLYYGVSVWSASSMLQRYMYNEEPVFGEQEERTINNPVGGTTYTYYPTYTGYVDLAILAAGFRALTSVTAVDKSMVLLFVANSAEFAFLPPMD